MERNEISTHEVAVFTAIKNASSSWLTSKEIAKIAGVADRTARAHASKLVKLGICDQAEVFPSHRYRFAEKASKRNFSYFQRIEQACEIFGTKETANG